LDHDDSVAQLVGNGYPIGLESIRNSTAEQDQSTDGQQPDGTRLRHYRGRRENHVIRTGDVDLIHQPVGTFTDRAVATTPCIDVEIHPRAVEGDGCASADVIPTRGTAECVPVRCGGGGVVDPQVVGHALIHVGEG